MKKAIILILFLCSSAHAANEIRAFEAGATTCYAVVREIDGDVWYPTGQVFEAWGTGARTAADYDIALTNKTGGMFVGSMDANIGAGQYYIVTHMQAGGSPADTDPAVWQEYGDWTGTVWTPATITSADVADAVWDEAVADHTTETSFGGEVGGLDPNLTLVLADTNELQTDWTNGGRLDLLIDGIKAMTDLIAVVTTTVAGPNDANNFTITAGIDVNDAYWFNVIMIEDATDSHREIRYIWEWQSTREVTVDEPFGFTPAAADNVWIMGTHYGGYLYDMWMYLKSARAPIYYNDTTGTTRSVGGVTHYTATGEDP